MVINDKSDKDNLNKENNYMEKLVVIDILKKFR